MTRNLLACFFISMLLSSPVLAGDDFFNGWIALEKKEYAKALELLSGPAEQGHAQAQYFLGMMYDKGYGVTEDDQTAIKWYRKAAEQGHIDAFRSLKEINALDLTESD